MSLPRRGGRRPGSRSERAVRKSGGAAARAGDQASVAITIRGRTDRAYRLCGFCLGLHLFDGLGVRGLVAALDRGAYRSGVGVLVVLRSLLAARVLQCAAELPDSDWSRRELARVSGDARAVLSAVNAVCRRWFAEIARRGG